MDGVDLSMKDVAKELTIVVTFKREKEFYIRLIIARYLIKIAAFIAGMGFRAEAE